MDYKSIAKKMKHPGKNIIYLFLGLFTAITPLPSCSEGNGPGNPDRPAGKVSLSIAFRPAPQLKANEGGGIDEGVFKRESAIYSLAVLAFKNGSDELNGKKFINREITEIAGVDYKDYKELDEIKDIELTSGICDVYIIANAPDGHFNDVSDRPSFLGKMEDLSKQGMYNHPVSGSAEPDNTPIGGEKPDDRFTNLVMSKSFVGLPVNSGAEKHYLGYTGNGGRPDGVTTGTPLKGREPVELVRLVARVAIQKIAFNLPKEIAFEPGIPTKQFDYFVDTVFLLNAKTLSSYFPEDDAFTAPTGAFGHGNIPGYNFLKRKFTDISAKSVYTDYLSIPVNFSDYDIEGDHAPLWFYAFENKDSRTFPTCFVIGVKFQYKNPGQSQVKTKKAYYPVFINRGGSGSGNNKYIKRNNQYGIKVTIKRVEGYLTDNPGLKSATLQAAKVFDDADGVLEIEETAGPALFPWTGNVYK